MVVWFIPCLWLTELKNLWILDKRKVSPIIYYLQYKVWHILVTLKCSEFIPYIVHYFSILLLTFLYYCSSFIHVVVWWQPGTCCLPMVHLVGEVCSLLLIPATYTLFAIEFVFNILTYFQVCGIRVSRPQVFLSRHYLQGCCQPRLKGPPPHETWLSLIGYQPSIHCYY